MRGHMGNICVGGPCAENDGESSFCAWAHTKLRIGYCIRAKHVHTLIIFTRKYVDMTLINYTLGLIRADHKIFLK